MSCCHSLDLLCLQQGGPGVSTHHVKTTLSQCKNTTWVVWVFFDKYIIELRMQKKMSTHTHLNMYLFIFLFLLLCY